MEAKLFDQLRGLGFSEELLEAAALFLPTAGRRFTISERQRIAEHDIKFAALLYYNQEKSILALRWYHVVNVTMPPFADARMVRLDQEMGAINFCDKGFVRSAKAAAFRDSKMIRKAGALYEALNTLDDRDAAIIHAKKMLKVKYYHDTFYGTHKLITDGTAEPYEAYFPTLTVDQTTGLVGLTDAVRLLVDKGLTNAKGKTEIESAVRALAGAQQRNRKARVDIPPEKNIKRKKH